jgi:hypothetical protein
LDKSGTEDHPRGGWGVEGRDFNYILPKYLANYDTFYRIV